MLLRHAPRLRLAGVCFRTLVAGRHLDVVVQAFRPAWSGQTSSLLSSVPAQPFCLAPSLQEHGELCVFEGRSAMKWSACSAAALSVLCVGLHAQQPNPQPQPNTPAPQAVSAHSTKVLTGCLRAGAAADTYMLTDATPKLDPQNLAGPPVGTSGEKADYDVAVGHRAGPERTAGGSETHVGQRVELTVRPAEPTVAPAANPNATQATSEAKPTERKPARVTVAALKSLAPSCS